MNRSLPSSQIKGFIGAVLKEKPRINEHGNSVFCAGIHSLNIDRYYFDGKECSSERGFKQYDTEQDAWYFGVWVDVERRLTVTYAEGDLSVVVCPNDECLRAELKGMEEFYGAAPPMAIGISQDGSVTKFYDERPKV